MTYLYTQVIDSDKYEVIYVSPRNYFVFTPMLAAASVGTVDVRSITEPIRMANPCVKYVSGEVIDINPSEKKVRRLRVAPALVVFVFRRGSRSVVFQESLRLLALPSAS